MYPVNTQLWHVLRATPQWCELCPQWSFWPISTGNEENLIRAFVQRHRQLLVQVYSFPCVEEIFFANKMDMRTSLRISWAQKPDVWFSWSNIVISSWQKVTTSAETLLCQSGGLTVQDRNRQFATNWGQKNKEWQFVTKSRIPNSGLVAKLFFSSCGLNSCRLFQLRNK